MTSSFPSSLNLSRPRRRRRLTAGRSAVVGVAAAAVVVGQAAGALATPSAPPTATVTVPESLQPVLRAQSADAGTHTMHFFARTVGSSTWDLLNDVTVSGTPAFQQLPKDKLSIGQGFEYQVKDCDSSGCALTDVQTGYVSPDLAAGPRPGATRLPFTVGDKVSAQVDVGSGNLFVSTTQLSLPRLSGSLSLGLAYNGLTLAPGSRFDSSISPGWRFSTGSDVRLQKNLNKSITYYGPNGLTGTFVPDGSGGFSSSGPQVKATLTTIPGGWTLAEHDSGDTLTFNSSGWLTTRADRSGNQITFNYNSVGALTQVKTDVGPDGARRVAVTHPDVNATRIDGLSQSPPGQTPRTVSYSYDDNGRLATITDVLGRHTDFGYGDAGDLTSITAPGGAETDFGYDSQHRVTAVTQPAAAGGPAVTRLIYNAGQTLEADPNTDQSQAVEAVPHTTYNLAGDGATGKGLDLIAKATDPAGHERSAKYTTFSDVASSQNSSGATTFGHDPATNGGESLTSITAATGAKSSYSYGTSGAAAQYQVNTATDSQGNVTTFSYDGTTGASTGATDASGAQAKITRNGDGTVATSVSPSGATTSYDYASDNGVNTKQVSSITPPSQSPANSLGVRSYTYDAFGRIATYASGRTDANGQPVVQTFSYDTADRVTQVDYSDGTSSVTYTYNPAGQVATRTDASGTTTYTYDPLGRLASRVHTAGGGTLTYAYDLDGNLVSETDGAGTTQHRYDSRNLETATVTPDGKTIAFGYNDDGQRIDAWFNTDAGHTTWSAHTHTSYDSANRITEVSTARNSSDTTKATDLSYSYTAPSSSSCSTVQAAVAGQDTGLRWSQTDHVSGITTSYCYDSANRLTKATGSNGETWTYSYDTNGNRTQVTHNGATVQTLNYNSANQINDTGYAYDAAGNLTTGTLATSTDQITLTYNGSDQLTGVSGYQTGSYTHAGTDQTELITQTVPGGGTWTYSYGRTDKNNLPILDTFTNTNGTNYLTHDANGNPLAFTTYQGSTSYYALDGLGSPVGLINTRGVLISTYTYDPYGQATANNLTGNTATDLNPYRFAGGLLDRTTGYIHFGQRYYNPGAGRWTQQDSVEVIGDPSRGNRYEYAGDNPMNYIDPAGRSFLDDFFEVLGYVNNGFGYGLACIGGIVTAEEIAGVPATAVAGPVGTVAVGVIGCAAGVGISYAGGEYIEP